MKLFSALVLAVCCCCKAALAEEVNVPDVGSVWKSTSIFRQISEDGSPPRKETTEIRVDRLQDGRPVFAGKFQTIEGELMESAEGTVIYANECKQNVPTQTLAPPPAPNQCAWHVCRAPGEGETFVRQLSIYAPFFGCQKMPGTYTFTSVRKDMYHGNEVTVGDAEITINGNRRGVWQSYIEEGVGEVYAESPLKVTTYTEISVPLIPYRTGGRTGVATSARVRSE
jgi:hypothetical protein